jgi:hypothetical protein
MVALVEFVLCQILSDTLSVVAPCNGGVMHRFCMACFVQLETRTCTLLDCFEIIFFGHKK